MGKIAIIGAPFGDLQSNYGSANGGVFSFIDSEKVWNIVMENINKYFES